MAFKKVLAYISAVVLCCGVAVTPQVADSFTSMVASAEDSYNGSCGKSATYSFDEATGTLTISGTGDIEDNPWYNYRENVKTVVIEDGITSIGICIFENCKYLESVSIPDTVTYIDTSAFINCSSLTEINIPNSVTEIGDETFCGCESLTSINIPDSVTKIGWDAFCDCTSLTSVTIPNSVTKIGDEAFGYYYEDEGGYEEIEDFTIYGKKSTEAERYANCNGFKFVATAEEKVTTVVKTESQKAEIITTKIEKDITSKEYRPIDALKLKKYILNLIADTTGLDFNGDGNVNILDLNTALNQLISK